ncbi:MAG: malto-oligosyltrehalose trehalohydrolase [Hyphomicrobiales bacterium]|nr:malto-oligosyltrehalose trehalohydrolase [Hyphomicrobiales bacterium]
MTGQSSRRRDHAAPKSGRLAPGAVVTDDGVALRVWAPDRARVRVALERGGEFDLAPARQGYFAGRIPARAGDLYWLRLDDDEKPYPDPASRSQPQGPHGPSQIVDPRAYRWRDGAWPGASIEGQVIYEMHVGTFTPEGSWASAAGKLPLLREVGVTLIEMMPVNGFPGAFGWGYDGVNLFAPSHLYGEPDDLRRFVDEAHALGIGVILDVVYNHLGPDGNYLARFARSYFTDRYENDWGEAINFDGEGREGVRDFFVANAAYWIEEFHFDGLRLDATQSIHDASDEHVLAEIARAARKAAGARSIVIVAENEPQDTRLVRPSASGGYGLDGLWNDDLHHSAMVALTGRNEAYYEDHMGAPQEFVSAAKYGYLFQGQRYAHQAQRRGTPGLDLAPAALVNFVQNHDQIANSASGLRFHQLASPGRARAMTAYMLLAPGTPMLFQGQEFFASTPFFYFADHKSDLASGVRKGRVEFLAQFPSIQDPAVVARLPAPDDASTRDACRLDWRERETHAAAVALHRDLLALRRSDPCFAAQAKGGLDGSVLAREAFVLRWFGGAQGDRLLIVNFGRDIVRGSFPEPLLAPPEGRGWRLLWSSEDPAYGGAGTPAVESEDGWRIPGHAAAVLTCADA